MNRTQLADAMLRGAKTEGVKESRHHIIGIPVNGPCLACAIGCALIGKHDGNYRKAKIALKYAAFNSTSEYQAYANLLSISPELAIEIEHRHLNGQTIEQIAAWLKGGE